MEQEFYGFIVVMAVVVVVVMVGMGEKRRWWLPTPLNHDAGGFLW